MGTGEFVSTGIDERAVGVAPFEIKVSFDLHGGKLSTSFKIPERMRSMANVEVLAHKVRPYTVSQRVTDLTPIFKSAGFKVIKSRMPMHTKEYEVGDYSGVSMKLVYNTETPYLGTRYVLQKLSNMHYNPLNIIRFSGVNYLGLTSTGLPSVRHHESKLTVHPSSCSTKEIEFVLKFGYATKEKGQSIIYHKMESSQGKLVKVTSRPIGEMSGHVRRQEKVKSMIEKLQVDSEGKALTVTVSTILKGSRPRTFSYTGTVGTGQSGMTSKWDVELMSEQTSKMICVRGDIRIPPYSIWKLNDIRSEDPVFRFHNTVGYGSGCESKVKIVGYAKTSERQKQLARETPEAKELERLRSKGTPMIEMSKPKLEVTSYRVSLPSKRCSPLPGHVRAELERETERCTKFSNKPTSGISTLSMRSESLYGYGSECRRHHHEIVERHSGRELCFSMIPMLECGSSCHPVGQRVKRVGYSCMPKDDRVTQHIAEKVRRGEVVDELVNMPEAYPVMKYMPVDCRPYTTYGMSGSSSGF